MLYIHTSLLLILGTVSFLVASVPTSVLIRGSQLNNNIKNKRSTSSDNIPLKNVPPNNVESTEVKKSIDVPLKASINKRGVTNPKKYEELYKNEEPLYIPGIFPSDFQEDRLDDLPFSSYHNRLNENKYENYRPSFIEFPPSYKYYGDRKKRSNKLNIPLKRDSLTPADMLALVALVEAGERSRHTDMEENENEFVKSNGNTYPTSYEIQNGNEDKEYGNGWLEPALVDYYGVPYNIDSIPKYELNNGISDNKMHNKRFMI